MKLPCPPRAPPPRSTSRAAPATPPTRPRARVPRISRRSRFHRSFRSSTRYLSPLSGNYSCTASPSRRRQSRIRRHDGPRPPDPRTNNPLPARPLPPSTRPRNSDARRVPTLATEALAIAPRHRALSLSRVVVPVAASQRPRHDRHLLAQSRAHRRRPRVMRHLIRALDDPKSRFPISRRRGERGERVDGCRLRVVTFSPRTSPRVVRARQRRARRMPRVAPRASSPRRRPRRARCDATARRMTASHCRSFLHIVARRRRARRLVGRRRASTRWSSTRFVARRSARARGRRGWRGTTRDAREEAETAADADADAAMASLTSSHRRKVKKRAKFLESACVDASRLRARARGTMTD